ncbi:MerR family transcriptional regulator [Peribacillus kribbensis]|uniref:MerR family transcriptional regulator n=1 Tax=Peribacillus kribbensis TaxID=356658 RepID=UPI000415815B|nr:MerR family transcriptional regulator [Peribacillus kribbensis]
MYTIKKVSELVGIPTVTIRAWENRYHIITPQRSEGGHRLYSEADIQILRWLKSEMETKDLKISEAVRMLKATPESNASIVPIDEFTDTSYQSLGVRLYRNLVDLETENANKAIDLAFSLYHYEEVIHKLMIPTLFQIGSDWESGKLTVAQEHFSSELIMQRFTSFFRLLPTNPQLPRVLAFCPEGEHHHIGLMVFSLFLRRKGIEVIYLGADTPYSGLIQLIKRKQIAAAAISLTDRRHQEALNGWIQSCHEEVPNLSFVVGGSGVDEIFAQSSRLIYLAEELDWDAWFDHVLLKQV